MLENEDRKIGEGESPEEIEDDFDLDGDDFGQYGGLPDTTVDNKDDEEDKDDIKDNDSIEDSEDIEEIPPMPAEEVQEGESAVTRGRRVKPRKKVRRKADQMNFLKKIKKPLILAACFVVFAVLVFFGFALSTIKEDRVMNNVYIEGMNVGGLTYDETLAAINASHLFKDSEITLTDGNKTFTINGADIGLSALPEQTTQKAMNYCKTENFFVKAFNAGMLLFRPQVIVPAPQVDEERLTEKLHECGNFLKGERKEHYYELTKELTATFYSGRTGYDGNSQTAHDQLIDALNKEQFKNIHVDFTSAPPQDMTPERIDAMVYADPVDAYYQYNGNEVMVIADINGRYIDKEAVKPLASKIYEGCEPVDVPYMVSYANVTAAALTEKLFANTLATYSTNYGGSTWNRCQNIARAASLISGTVVPPGEVFSFNDTVGHRTKDNGFYTAKEYINGESVDGIGGGTCQVSSTLYSAVLYADMGIIERLNHMMSVGYIPLGQDATVADGGVDFKFKNSSDYPVKIAAYTNGSTITVSILGTMWEPARKVEIKNNVNTVGENTVVYSTRYVYANGELISTDSLNSSTYMPHKVATTAETSSDSGDDSDSDE